MFGILVLFEVVTVVADKLNREWLRGVLYKRKLFQMSEHLKCELTEQNTQLKQPHEIVRG